MGDGKDEVFVGADVGGVAALGHDFAAAFVLIFGAVGVCKTLKDILNCSSKHSMASDIVKTSHDMHAPRCGAW